MTAKIKEVLGFNLPVSMVATSHGIVWREDPTQIIPEIPGVGRSLSGRPHHPVLRPMSNNTRMMADAIAQGIHEVDPGRGGEDHNVARHDKNEILTQVFRSKGILVGSSTMNNVMMPKVAGMLEEITGLRFRNKRASAFGSYGWTGGAVDRIQTLVDGCRLRHQPLPQGQVAARMVRRWPNAASTAASSPVSGRCIRWTHPARSPTTQTAVTPAPDARCCGCRAAPPPRLNGMTTRPCSAPSASGSMTRRWVSRISWWRRAPLGPGAGELPLPGLRHRAGRYLNPAPWRPVYERSNSN